MLDQSFSERNFEVIFNLQNRMGKIELTSMPLLYQQIVADIKVTKGQISSLRKKKKLTWTIDDALNFEIWGNELKELQEKKHRSYRTI